jgi:hypothetical protein
MDRNNLIKLIDFVIEISDLEENQWFKDNLSKSLSTNVSLNNNNAQLDEIYEYCLNKILNDQAKKFYDDIKLPQIQIKLMEDFIRMERFRREDNFEDFCLALFQQIEGIVNELSTNDIRLKFISTMNNFSHKVKNKETNIYENKKLWQLILFPNLSEDDLKNKVSKQLLDWDFMERFKLIMYFHYYNEKIYNFYDFQKNVFLCNELYQSRNLNHRGGNTSDKQKTTVEKVKSNSHKYYFKFLGFIEDITTTLNSNI